jgi:DNA polymerase-3 subunit alpha
MSDASQNPIAPEKPRAPFVHLHAHSMYSLSDALGDVSDLVDRAKELGYDAVALTDHSGLYGAVEFYEAAHKAGIKAIIGVEANLAPHKHTDKRPGIDTNLSHITLLAETNEGYRNLLQLVSIAYLDGFYYKPRLDKDLLRQFHGGLIALSGCAKGEIPKACHAHDFERAEQLVRQYQEIFGADSFFLELVHRPESPTQNEINEALIELSKKTGAPLVATKNTHYLSEEDREAQDALTCIHDGKMLADQNRMSTASVDASFCGPEAMVEAFAAHPDAITNTRVIADRCQVTLELGKNLLPQFIVPEGETEVSHLRGLCAVGLVERYPDPEKQAAARERMEFELATIERMGFAAYFLIVQDYIVWAKEHGVIVGPGRGSAAGSVVAYVLRITNLDPLRYGLLFERFLNPDRISMPDIDTDFDDVKRGDVINYVSEKYGVQRVSGIITFGTMAARAAVRDVGRVLGLPYADVDRVSKVIPPPVQGKHIPLKDSVQEAPELKQMYESDPRIKRLIDLAIRLEGTTRHASQHACAIVIAPRDLVEFAPLQKAQGGDVAQVIQYSMHSAEVCGLLKMDFLGLSNLSIIRDCLEIIQAVHGETVVMDTIPLDDPKTFELLGSGDTTGVFQLESDGMKKYIRELKPSVIEDIIAMVALYRPGPMQFIDSFIARKHGREKIVYKHELTENALRNTYGLPIYQEQVMQVAKDMAGFTGGQADTLRKAMGKKIAKLMAEMKVKFVEGSMKNGVTQAIAEEIFTQFEEFAAYGFNKSHAACYAYIAYQTAYLKAHYPECFMAALLNSDCTNLDRVSIEVEECRRMGIEVLPPDLNESFTRFSVIKGQHRLRFGLLAIKGLGEDVVDEMIKERKERGPYKDLADFAMRIKTKSFNRRSLESLIKAGALDCFGDRNAFYFNIEGILAYHKRVSEEEKTGQVNLFASSAVTLSQPALTLKPAPAAALQEKLSWEKELLGLYVSSHPFREYFDRLKGLFVPITELALHKKEKSVRMGGMIVMAKKILTKNNEPMVFTKVEDTSGSIEAVVFPRVYKEKPELWEGDHAVILSGRVQEKDGDLKFLVESGYEITPENIEQVEKYVTTNSGVSSASTETNVNGALPVPKKSAGVLLAIRATFSESLLQQLRAMFEKHPGMYTVSFLIDQSAGRQRVLSSYRIAFDELIAKELEMILGPDTVKVET